MRIDYRREGGFTGIPLSVSIDTQDLGPEGRAVEESIQRSGLLDADSPGSPPSPPHPDAFTHFLTIEEGGRRRTVQLSDPVPEKVAPLLAVLRRLARPPH